MNKVKFQVLSTLLFLVFLIGFGISYYYNNLAPTIASALLVVFLSKFY